MTRGNAMRQEKKMRKKCTVQLNESMMNYQYGGSKISR